MKNGKFPWCALFRKTLKIGVLVVCLLCKALLCILGVLCGFLTTFTNFLTKLKFRLPAACIGSTVHPRCIMWFSGQFFFLLSVQVSLLNTKLHTKIKEFPYE